MDKSKGASGRSIALLGGIALALIIGMAFPAGVSHAQSAPDAMNIKVQYWYKIIIFAMAKCHVYIKFM